MWDCVTQLHATTHKYCMLLHTILHNATQKYTMLLHKYCSCHTQILHIATHKYYMLLNKYYILLHTNTTCWYTVTTFHYTNTTCFCTQILHSAAHKYCMLLNIILHTNTYKKYILQHTNATNCYWVNTLRETNARSEQQPDLLSVSVEAAKQKYRNVTCRFDNKPTRSKVDQMMLLEEHHGGSLFLVH